MGGLDDATGLSSRTVKYHNWGGERDQEPEELELRADREFDFQLETQHLHVVGYDVEEVAELLRLYRAHMELIAAFAQRQNGLGDAYRSGPVQP